MLECFAVLLVPQVNLKVRPTSIDEDRDLPHTLGSFPKLPKNGAPGPHFLITLMAFTDSRK